MTIANFETVAELQDLLKAKDYDNAEMAKSYAGLDPAKQASDPPWLTDFTKYRKAYELATVPARAKVFPFSVAPISVTSLIPAPLEWDLVISSQKPAQDLYTRLVKMGGFVDGTKMPQPRPLSDTDLEAFKKADEATRAIDKKLPAQNPWPYVFGGVAVLTAFVLVARR